MATVALTDEQYEEIITTMKEGGITFRPNPRIAAALVVEATLGLRIGDVLELKLSDIVRDGGRYRLDIVEKKTGKTRHFTVKPDIYCYLRDYADAREISKHDRLFPFSARAVQKHLATVCDYLEIEGVSTHSFRKYFATKMYNDNGHDVVLVQHILQHSSAAVTQRYIGIEQDRIEDALAKHAKLL